MDAKHRAQFFARTNGVLADGEVVWFWRPDAGAKFTDGDVGLIGPTRRDPVNDGGKKARFTGKSTKEAVKTIAQGMPRCSVYLW